MYEKFNFKFLIETNGNITLARGKTKKWNNYVDVSRNGLESETENENLISYRFSAIFPNYVVTWYAIDSIK